MKDAPFLGGEQPLYADYLVFGAFQWARSISAFQILAADDPLRAWLERCRALHGGLGRNAAAAPHSIRSRTASAWPGGRGAAQGRVRSSSTSPSGATICTLTGPPAPRAAAQRSSRVLA